MIKVLIVDDEKLERFLICNGVKWEENGFTVVGDAESGEQALRLYDMHKPEIVLTDIYMPSMDGLELAQKLLDRSKEVAIIIITGHRDFFYAQRAIKIGVKDFILKPIDSDEVIRVCMKIKNEIHAKKLAQEEIIQLQSNLTNILEDAAGNFLLRTIRGNIEEFEILSGLRKYKLGFLDGLFVCIRCRYSDDNKNIDKVKSSISCYFKRIKFKISGFIVFHSNVNTLTILVGLLDNNHDDMNKLLYDLYDSLGQKYCKNITLGISDLVDGVKNVRKAYIQAEKALQAAIISEHNNVVHFSSIPQIGEKENPTKNRIFDVDYKRFSFILQNGLRDQIHDFIKEYSRLYFESSNSDNDVFSVMMANLISAGGVVLSKMGISPSYFYSNEYNLYEKLQNIKNVNEIDYINSSKSKKIASYITEAMEYIELNYCNSELSLNTLAEHLHVNASYLSRIFKQMTGESVTQYITRKRIEKSIELLNTTDLMVYEIAEKVGFNDPHYFSICFKKMTGKTINEYRKSI